MHLLINKSKNMNKRISEEKPKKKKEPKRKYSR
jgi:hypothetical protein